MKARMNIMNKRLFKVVILGALLCGTTLPAHSAWFSITTLPAKIFQKTWTQGLKPNLNKVWNSFVASDMYQNIKWGALGAGAGAGVGGVCGFTRNVGKQASLVSIFMDTALGSVFGGISGCLAGVFGWRVRKDLKDKTREVDAHKEQLKNVGIQLSKIDETNKKLALNFVVLAYQNKEMEKRLKAARFMQQLVIRSLREKNTQFAQTKKKLDENMRALVRQEESNERNFKAEIRRINRVIENLATSEQVQGITNTLNMRKRPTGSLVAGSDFANRPGKVGVL